MTNFPSSNSYNPLSPFAQQLRVSQSYFTPPGQTQSSGYPTYTGGNSQQAAYNPWMPGTTAYAQSTMPWGSQSLAGQPGGSTAYFLSPQAGGYMPMNTIPGLSSYPGAFSVRPQGPSYGYPGGDQFIAGPYTGGYDVTGLYDQGPSFPPRGGYPTLGYPSLPPRQGAYGARRPNPFNASPALNLSRFFVSPQELQNGFDFGLSSILNTKPRSNSGGLGQFTSDLSFLANDPLFSQFLDADTINQINGFTSTSPNLDSLLAGLDLGGMDTNSISASSDDIDAELASLFGTAVASPPSSGSLDDAAIQAALDAFNQSFASPPATAPAPAPEPAPAPAPVPSPSNNGNGGFSTL